MRKDNRIMLINQNNQGPSSARNKGIDEASGRYILFVDSDDFLESDALNYFRNILIKGDYDTVLFNHKIFNKKHLGFNNKQLFEDGYTYDHKNIKDIYKRLVATSDLNHPVAKYYSTKIIKENKIKFDENIFIGEDRVFNMEYFYYSRRGIYYDLYFYNYRYNPESLTKTFKMSKFHDLIQTHSARMYYIQKYDLDQDIMNKAKNFTINSLFQLVSTAINFVSIEEVKEKLEHPLFVELINESKGESIKNKIKLLILKRQLFKLMRLLQRIKIIGIDIDKN